MIQECMHSDPVWTYYQDKDWIKPQRDTVLLRYTNEETDDSVMKNKKVGRLLLLFSLVTSIENKTQDLEFVEMFGISPNVDGNCSMYKVKKTRTYEVVEIETIEQGVHLIPVYQGTQTAMATPDSELTLDAYSEFWLNNHINLHQYNSIY